METTDNKILDKIEDIFEHIKIIIEDSIIRDSELEVCFRALDLALERSQECGLLKTQLEITNRRMEEVVKYSEMVKGSNWGWENVHDNLPITNGEYVVQWEHAGLINIELAVYEQGKWIAVRDSLDITPKVVAWRKINPYKRKENNNE